MDVKLISILPFSLPVSVSSAVVVVIAIVIMIGFQSTISVSFNIARSAFTTSNYASGTIQKHNHTTFQF